MSEKPSIERNSEEKLGEFLKRARLAANIDQSEFAREIRIPTEMLDHLENGRYDKLPVQAYVRGYLNTICNRLELDRAKILDWYASEVGRETRSNSIVRDLGIAPVVRSSSSSSDSGPNKMVLILVVLFIGLFIVVLKTRNSDSSDELISADSTQSVDSAALADSSSNQDSTALTAAVTDSATQAKSALAQADSVKAADSASAKQVAVKPIETMLKFECIKDSTWLRVKKKGGLPWDRFVRAKDKPRFVSHTDTMLVNVGSPEKTRMYINDVKVSIPSGIFHVFNGEIVSKPSN